MAFVTGILLIDAPASALNNAGLDKTISDQNVTAVKSIQAGRDKYPYVSAQAFRYWLRTTIPKINSSWINAPIYKEASSLAYTAADPIKYCDDDLFGYMRAPQKENINTRKNDPAYTQLTPLDKDKKGNEQAVTRISPFRVSTLVSLAPVTMTQHFESMSRHEGDPVPYSSEFYRATLRGLFSLDLHACGTFSYMNKTGFRNLDSVREALAKDVEGIEHLEEEKSYRLPQAKRVTRIKALFEGMAHLEGGAKQTLHYTDVSPALVIMAVTKGGNHIFGHVIGANKSGQPVVKTDALREALTVFADTLLSPVYVGWVRGYLDEERASFETFAAEYNRTDPLPTFPIVISHPREAFLALVNAFDQDENSATWLK